MTSHSGDELDAAPGAGVRGIAGQRFQRLVENIELQDLAEIALAIAQQDRPELDLAQSRETLTELASDFQEMVAQKESNSSVDHARNLCGFIFEKHGFHGNDEEYYDPDNSYLDRLLNLRRGIPISLALLYIHIGRTAGLDVQGIGFPGHFLVGVYQESECTLIDPFAGRVVTSAGLTDLLRQQRGDSAVIDEAHTQPVAARDIVLRLINNLRAIYQQRGDHQRVLICCDQIIMIDPENPQELFQRITIYLQLERRQLALMELNRLRDKVDNSPFRQRIEAMMLEIDFEPGPLQ